MTLLRASSILSVASLAELLAMVASPMALAQAAVGPNGEIDGLNAKFVEVAGVNTRYYDYGQGEAIVLVHGGLGVGGTSTANNWSRNIPGLAEHFRVLAFDRLGQGMTEAPRNESDFGYEGAIEHLYEFVRAMGLEQVHLVGHSSGGALAFYAALEHPEIVKTLTIVSVGPGMPRVGVDESKFDKILEENCPPPPGFEYTKCRLKWLGYTDATFPPEFTQAEDWMAAQPAWLEARTRVAAMRDSRRARRLQDADNELRERAWERARNGELKMPIMLIASKQDPLSWYAGEEHAMMTSELDFFDIVGSMNKRVKMVLLNEGAHFPYRDQPEQFNAELEHFIEFWDAHPNLLAQ
jgi:2-hydroxy-6-oxonona-2,4-dienedioate hydrolase